MTKATGEECKCYNVIEVIDFYNQFYGCNMYIESCNNNKSS